MRKHLGADKLYEKTISNKVKCKSSVIYSIDLATYGNYDIEDTVDFMTYITNTDVHYATSLVRTLLLLVG